ncbi:transcriptional regulator, NifA subfamily, Fis Family [Thermocrinis albus DSM 14484]|uniref:Transcriptional regulator, NifA subfamily, Fis Family n=1 Tax=Thermocrinis albus (strain DSM 14484 / JCM 11386 / HI 11/12) TaxID=638303 RepID=D3SPH1_THEAH|nr:sigma-54-dependent Fis family transcriptional regulator [Thermocrinis albus]ADC89058.1 transcriptional regulator, NifA subfamily, Fis Family [Thermocrinis albus DSM 14484]
MGSGAVDRFLRKEIQLLYNLSRELSSMSKAPNAIADDVVRLLSDLDGVERVVFYIKEEDDKISVISSVGAREKVTLKRKEGVVGHIFEKGYPVVLKSLSEEPLFLNKLKRENLEEIIFIGVPIKYEGRVVGVLTIDKRKDSLPSDYFVELLTMISNLIGNYIGTYVNIKRKEEFYKREIAALKSDLIKIFTTEGFVGVSKAYYDVIKRAMKVANLDVTVMIRGESGTGKTTLAKLIHYASQRRNGPFVEVNCSTIPVELLEAELFGYEKGAFTGAHTTKPGKVEIANGGTIFFDEIGDISPSVQTKLLRFLQTKEFERLGSNKTMRSDVRIIVATNRNLEEEVSLGRFREDLYYRIAVYSIYIPPLRERKEDIPVLVDYYLSKLNKVVGKEKLSIKPDALEVLLSCSFPGNVRELVNCLTRAAINSDNGVIEAHHLACISSGMCYAHLRKKLEIQSTAEKRVDVPQDTIQKENKIEEHGNKSERDIIIEALEKCGYVQAKAARYLGMTVRQLNYRIKKYGIKIKKI